MMLLVRRGNKAMEGSVIVPIGMIEGSERDERLRPGLEFFCKRREGWMPGMQGTKEYQEPV